MKRLLLLLVACGGFAPQPHPSHRSVPVLLPPRLPDAGSTASADAGSTASADAGSTASADASSSADASPGSPGPAISSLDAGSARLTQGESLHIVAVVAGAQTGRLSDPTGTIDYGSFTDNGDGSYAIDLSWAQLEQAAPINFTSEEVRTLRADFSDLDGHSASRSLDVTLDCNGLAACAGSCVNLSQDSHNCGACNNALGPLAHCAGGTPACNSSSATFCPALADCVALSNDVENCGACGHACGGTSRCLMSQCQWELETSVNLSCDALCAGKKRTCVEGVVRRGALAPEPIPCDTAPGLSPSGAAFSLTCWCA
jgi:hypothetical protein